LCAIPSLIDGFELVAPEPPFQTLIGETRPALILVMLPVFGWRLQNHADQPCLNMRKLTPELWQIPDKVFAKSIR
jgi:hypothetical protein